MAIIVHVHKRTADETGAELTKKIDAAWVEIEAFEKSSKGKTGADLELIIRKITAAKRSANELEDRLRTYKQQGKGLDHRLDFNKNDPATDAERRDRIQQVVRNTGCTSAVATRWLEAEEWIVDTTVRELKHAMRLGFTVDAKAGDRGYSDISSMAALLMRQAQKIANLANGDGDAEDVKDIKFAVSTVEATFGDLKRAAANLKPLIQEK
jgi:predicted house-cleaning noncanonical NTP pyrophosphatase (MazG superfamily)